ncbi:uncharacterized protein SAZU_8026 [Streptomyces azureus]|uniref:Uncharacterized protein n=1 Tax=Streptomyces azureus TaxID=146537 RepID=A0A0K8PZ19_STRAJ|nr:uncharacterized protein SAZU_8026 [Streptomyces azureus]
MRRATVLRAVATSALPSSRRPCRQRPRPVAVAVAVRRAAARAARRAPPLAVFPQVLAEYAYDKLPVPDTEIEMASAGKSTVNLPT